jgi:fatty acid desaturase
MAHHIDPNLTDPYEDPESWYLDPRESGRLPRLMRQVLEANNTLAGRLLLGPAVGLFGFWRAEVRLMRAGRGDVLRAWGEHLVFAGVLVAFLSAMPGISGWGYVAACYGGASLLSLRTFLEHQAAPETGHRTVLIEDRGPLAWLFLFNSLHAVHHERPKLAWHSGRATRRKTAAMSIARIWRLPGAICSPARSPWPIPCAGRAP